MGGENCGLASHPGGLLLPAMGWAILPVCTPATAAWLTAGMGRRMSRWKEPEAHCGISLRRARDAPCASCGSLVQILEATPDPVAVVEPSRDFYTSLGIRGTFSRLPSNIGRCSTVVLDLRGGAPLLSSSAIAEIVTLHKMINATERRLKLVVDASVIRECLLAKQLDRFLSIHGSVEEALESS